ncbi:zinc finger protein CONSTANS-LIKE 7 isoform X1 [Beta vulgaris subsp. vulgaris]|uniref:zinc finger protein CONSTANS-LIKE 7 isoform X1 n=1 Tax=Beta vulgaris subsp. vulgaris TaxID=3555 RepID=UPI0020374B9D|nr:zinc finger protein CONSTANS-LIKE 7 isoform X1 [Beta vulgaris subsp. vulgaris]
MYAETGLLYPYFQNFCQEVQPLEELCCYSQEPTSSLDSIITTSTISDYDLGGEGDLFKAPEPIIEEPIGSLDPMTIAMITCVDNGMPTSGLEVADMESLQNEQLLCDVFDGCENELFEKTSVETSVCDVLDIKVPLMMTNEVQTEENKSLPDLPFSKCGSSGSLNSMEWVSSATMRPNFLDFPEMDFGAAYGMRRAFSEGDIKTLASGNISLMHSPLQRPLQIGNCPSEERLQKLSRYRNKKSRRNFGRKIKYACRKALADSQPRIRGRFAKTEDTDSCKKQ